MSSKMELSAYGASDYSDRGYENVLDTYEDDANLTGSTGAYATGKFAVDLSRGTVKTYAYATTGTNMTQPNYAKADVTASYLDTLTFYIPTGTYHDNLYVSFEGSLEGMLTHSSVAGDPTPTIGQSYSFSAVNTVNGQSDRWGTVGPMYNTPGVFDQDFTLTVLLAKAGEYISEQAVSFQLGINLISRAWVDTHDQGVGWAETDFYNTASFDAVIAPQEVTWESESTHFLSAAVDDPPTGDPGAPVPEPSTFILMALGIGALAAGRLKKHMK